MAARCGAVSKKQHTERHLVDACTERYMGGHSMADRSPPYSEASRWRRSHFHSAGTVSTTAERVRSPKRDNIFNTRSRVDALSEFYLRRLLDGQGSVPSSSESKTSASSSASRCSTRDNPSSNQSNDRHCVHSPNRIDSSSTKG